MPQQLYWCWDSRQVSPDDPCPYCRTHGLYEDRAGPRVMPVLWCSKCEQIVALGHPLRRQAGTGREGRESVTTICGQCHEPVRVHAWFVAANVVCYYVSCACGGASDCVGLLTGLKVAPVEPPKAA